MTPDRHRRAKEIFLRACDVAPDERSELLDLACEGDAELRALVDALLGHHRERAAVDRRGEPATRLVTGQIVDGKYVVEARIGAGGMGEVYRARQLALDRAVVIKVLPPDPPRDSMRRFEREARALARLNHPHVVTVHDLGVATDVGHYLVMEYVEGRTLRDEARRRGALPIAAAVELMRQVCAGAAAAHAAGVIHRDLKPENILLEGEGEILTAKVADFGIARLAEPAGAVAESMTGTGVVVGTAHYMSPEQTRGDDADARSDVYALGCVLYELLTGRTPFTATSVLAVLEKHRVETPEALSALRPEVPAALDRAVARALEKRRELRWQTAAELGDALANVARGDAIGESAETEPLRAAAPNNLPSPLTRCIGREREIAELTALLVDDTARLVTVTGTGGIGKTRLSVEVAHAVATDFPDGVFQVDLAPLSDPALLAQRIAHVFGVKESSGSPVADELARFLREKRMLLVLDNFEHLLDGAPLVARLLETAPRLKGLVTSQAPLHVRGEREYALETLAVPPLDVLAAPDELERSPAVALFVERARQETPSFAVTAENARAVAEVCQRLDGLPLAIELAAARVKLLAPRDMTARLEHMLALLTGGARDLPERQRTMRAAVSWSYELLDEHEKALLRSLSVFSGGCTLEAAEAVCAHDGADVLDALGSLVDKSLLRRRDIEAETRFGMLEVVREFAQERLEVEDEADAVRLRHARHFLAVALDAHSRSSDFESSHVAVFGHDFENFTSAFALLLDCEPRDGVKMAVAFRRYWPFVNLYSEGIAWIRRALASEGAEPADRALLLAAEGAFEGFLGDHDAAGEHVRAALAIARTLDDRYVLLDVLNCAIICLLSRPVTHAEARAYLEEALEIARELGLVNRAAALLVNLSALASIEGRRESVRRHNEEALGIATSEFVRASCLLNLGDLSLEEGDLAEATSHLRAGLVIVRGYGDRAQAAFAIESLAEVALRRGAPEKAVRLAGVVDALYETTGGVRKYITRFDSWERVLAEIREALEPSTFEREWSRGRTMDFDEAIAEALRDD